ncbi:head-tail joining protein [Sphingomonas morindae]|uniref:Head-tail adaptor protein n=1 Tax=Sphingomonas morindae TaxID=1541170 RepID=A0ABY4X409_9SPHN|nr:hypothetical protein [Sphingomonas morindae]USI71619.1 hypothetical protein LHA26_09745 [Sphingomonas morindae]
MIDWGAGLAAIDAAFAEPVSYSGAGLAAGAPPIAVIWSDVAGQPGDNGRSTTRVISCEIRKELLPARPGKSDRLTRAGVTWSPIEVVDRDDLGRWQITLERAR